MRKKEEWPTYTLIQGQRAKEFAKLICVHHSDRVAQFREPFLDMNDFEVEKEELSLIYGNNVTIKSKECVEIAVVMGIKRATITITVGPDYPNQVPEIAAELEGSSGEKLQKHLIEAANTMKGLSMISYIVGETMDYLTGISEQEIVEQQEHISSTPFSRENFLLWLEKFKAEMKSMEDSKPKPMTGRQMFELGHIKDLENK